MSQWRALWQYRGFIAGFVRRNFQAKYRNSVLGAAWNIINPLAMIFIYTIIFSEIMRAKLPGTTSSFAYSIYLCAGILTWGLFAEITTRSQNLFLENANLLKKISFPRLCLPIIVALTAALNFAIVLVLFTLFLVATSNFPGLVYGAIAPVLLLLVFFASSLGLVLGVLNVFFRDVGQFFSIFIMFWFWLTPIVYPVSIVPEAFRWLLALNPLAPVFAAIQGVLVYSQWPQWATLVYPAVLAGLLAFTALMLYRRHADDMVDEL